MTTEWKVFAPLTLFFLIVGSVYGYFTRLSEPIGLIALLLAGVLLVMITVYLAIISRKIDRPEDKPGRRDCRGCR